MKRISGKEIFSDKIRLDIVTAETKKKERKKLYLVLDKEMPHLASVVLPD